MGPKSDRKWRLKEISWGAAVLAFASVAYWLAKNTPAWFLHVTRFLVRIVLYWHPFPVWGWFVVVPLNCLGLWWIGERVIPKLRPRLPEMSRGVRWRAVWDGKRIVGGLVALCPNVNCDGRELQVSVVGHQTVLACLTAGCGFHQTFDQPIGNVLGDVRLDLEAQARGELPPPPAPPKSRMFSI